MNAAAPARPIEEREVYHDGEVTWWRCEFCLHHFDLEDMEILSGDSQACLPCVSGWRKRGCP